MVNSQFTTEGEIWKPIPGFPGYEVSDQGRVRSFWQICRNPYQMNTPQRTLRLSKPNRYPYVCLYRHGKLHRVRIHRLVLMTFIGPCPPGMEACHEDGKRTNNFVENLRWDTPVNNCADTRKHGSLKIFKGMANGKAKLTDAQVIRIRELAIQGYPYRKIGEMFGVCSRNISCIVLHKTWVHI